MAIKRASGLLLHITSLPSKYGVGDFGPEAFRFVDFLARAGQKYWQMLPLNPVTLRQNPYSPYNCLSAFAGNWLLISPEFLYLDGLLGKKDLADAPAFDESRVEFQKAVPYKAKLLNLAYERFEGQRKKKDYEKFCNENAGWLDDFALFIALRQRFCFNSWCDWPAEIRDRDNIALKKARAELKDSIDREKFLQFIFFRQWFSLKRYCNRQGVKVIGDIPIYVAYDSVDVWANPGIFKLTRSKKPRFISGVPPDLFSRTGQLWGNPVYDWQTLKERCYDWWLERLKHNLALFDLVRIDHFRGLVAYWQVPAGQQTAIKGKWVKGPGDDFFDTLFKRFSAQSVIAEDLGYITADVKKIIEKYRLAGMKVLQFGFGGNPARNTHFPANHTKNSVVYTGTHDNNTVVGWFKNEIDARQKKRLFACLGRKPKVNEVHLELIKLAMSSIANLAVVPVQDVLGLGQKTRMNHPALKKGNWQWRLRLRCLTSKIAKTLAKLTALYGRT